MKKILLLPLVGALTIFAACNKQSEADRQAEIDRQVQQKLDAEHQAQQREDLARREGELNAREQALANQQNTRTESRDLRERTDERETRTQDRQIRGGQPASAGDYALFYSKLEPHGDWIETSDYGYVFHPREAERTSWRPYTDGRWVYTDAGWTWVSQEPFGWATYHYGRWIRLRNVGWVWIPGDEWAPAWVSWRKSDNYVGWAPLPPEARFDRRTGIHNWADSYYDIGPENYCFIETRQFGTPQIERAIVPQQQNITIVNQTTNVTNITYNNTTVVNQGPSYDEIRTRSAEPVQRLKLEREVNVNINVGEPRAVVRSDAVVIPAPVIVPSRVVQKPKIVKKTVTNVVVERGWDAQDRQAAEKVREKIRSEATPPPDAPPKTFVRASETRGEPTTASASSPTATAAKLQPTATAAPATTPAPTASIAATVTPTATVTPNATAVPSASAAPQTSATASITPRTRMRPIPRHAPESSVSPNDNASSSSGSTPMGARIASTPGPTPLNVRGPDGKFRSVRKMVEPENPSPGASGSPSASPAGSASASATAAPTRAPRVSRPDPEIVRQTPPPLPSASAETGTRSTSSPAAPSPSASEASSPVSRQDRREMRREDKQERKRERRESERGLTSPTVSPSATP